VEAGSASEPGNYVLADGNLTTYSAELQTDQTNVVVTTDPMVAGRVCTNSAVYCRSRRPHAERDGAHERDFYGLQSTAVPSGNRHSALQ